ncbi:MotA/TolQ/ExbB proton channel family protein [Mitsuokella jalaludinii]|uniref:MotA/TolQ/ExbB proton channel family protein n=1 Tax=Mitsuokella jalaludinii TaxID=187979 RepID=UPI003F9A560A
MDQNTVQNTVTVLYCSGMVIWGFIAGRRMRRKLKVEPDGDYSYGQIAATLGVLGTFIGILIGLIGFNTDMSKMQNSVIGLLDGMKTAFFTSVLGMVMSLIFKGMQAWAKNKAQKKDFVNADASIADLINYMHSKDEQDRADKASMIELMKNNNAVLKDTISSSIADMTRSIVGDGDYTVIGQMKTLRLETRDELGKIRESIKSGNDTMIKEFRDFAKTMAENNTKAFIEALNETMKDFNTKLTEQFGENFKELNKAVGKLLEWQEHYKETIETVTENQKVIFAGIEQAKASLQNIDESSKGMTASAEKMADLIVTANEFNERLNAALKDLEELSKNAHDVVPQIQALMAATGEETKKITTESIDAIKESTKQSLENWNTSTKQAVDELGTNVLDTIKTTAAGIKEHNDTITASVQNVNNETVDKLKNSADEAAAYIMTMAEDYERAYTDVFKKLDELSDLLTETANKEQTNSKQALDSLTKQADATVHAIEDVTRTMRDMSTKQREDFEAETKATHDAVRKAAEKLGTSALNVTQDISDRLDEMMKTNNESLKKSSENLSRDLDNKVTASLESLGIAMSQITKRFAEDYGPLADKLREIVRLADNIDRRRR